MMCVSCRWFLAIVVTVAIYAARPAVAAADTPTVRVLCYNIHYGQGNDGRYDVERLAKVISAAKPDLVALQEVDVGVTRSGRVHQAQKLGKLTQMAARFGPTQHYQGGLYGNAVLSRLPILDVQIFPLPYSESTAERTTYPRGAIAVTVRATDRKPLRLVSTHFQHNVPEDRLAEAKKINRLFAGKDAIRTILAGDMNARPDAAPIKELLKRWTIADNGPLESTAPASRPSSRIDYIFYRSADRFGLRQAEVVAEARASDHRPVFAEIELIPAP